MCHPLDLPRLPRKEEEFLFLSDLIYGLSLSLLPSTAAAALSLSLSCDMNGQFRPQGRKRRRQKWTWKGRENDVSLFQKSWKKSRSLLHELMFVLKWLFLPNCRLAPECKKRKIATEMGAFICPSFSFLLILSVGVSSFSRWHGILKGGLLLIRPATLHFPEYLPGGKRRRRLSEMSTQRQYPLENNRQSRLLFPL